MLRLVVPARELYDEEHNLFLGSKETKLDLEHSLVSLSKWESKWCVPFLGDEPRTGEQTLDYVSAMTITQNVDQNVYLTMDRSILAQIEEYIARPMTATVIRKQQAGRNREVVTAELIYYWMIALNIPFECQKWHLNKLLTLINVCNIKNSPKKNMGRREVMQRNTELNAARKAALGTRG